MKLCRCDRWKFNMAEIKIILRSPLQCAGGYTGEAFEYCPWCGKELITVDPKKEAEKDEHGTS